MIIETKILRNSAYHKLLGSAVVGLKLKKRLRNVTYYVLTVTKKELQSNSLGIKNFDGGTCG